MEKENEGSNANEKYKKPLINQAIAPNFWRAPNDIYPRNEVVLNVDLFQRGLGGINSWGATPLEKYRYKNENYQFSYTLSIVQF